MAAIIVQRKLLVIEGHDDEEFLDALVKHEGLNGIQLHNVRGKANLRPELKALKRTPGFSDVVSLGLIRDADSSVQDTFTSVRDAFRDADLPVPDSPMVPAGNNPQVLVMLMPDCVNTGELEDLCLRSVATQPAMLCVDDYFLCLKNRDIPEPRKLSRAKVHAYLTSMPELKRLGESAQAGYWPWTSTQFDQLRDFLRQL